MKFEQLDQKALVRLERQWKDSEVTQRDIRKLFGFSPAEIQKCVDRWGPKPKFGRMPEFGKISRP